MKLTTQQMQTPHGLRTAYVAIPDEPYDPLWKSSSITVLREGTDEASALELLRTSGLDKIVDREKCTVALPNPVDGVWHAEGVAEMTPDEKFIQALSESALPSGRFSQGWRTMADVHYLIGLGSGATLVHILTALYPTNSLAAAICTVGGGLPKEALARAAFSPVPAYLLHPAPEAAAYYIQANQASDTGRGQYACPWNPLQKVLLSDQSQLDAQAGRILWEEFFRVIRRTNTSPAGDVDRRQIPEECGFEWHVKDTSLGDNGGLDHDWLEACPQSVREHPEVKVPLLLFSHGMSDNPLKAADMAKFHEVGAREGFITVYTFSCNRYGWNLSLDPDKPSDEAFYLALIEYLKRKYPIDETRIYTSGFSNGAGMAMVFAMTHPEIVAASCPIDSTFPYAAMGHFRPGRPAMYIMPVLAPGEEPPRPFMPPRSDPEQNLAPLRRALEKQKEKRYTLPIMYFYGTRESEYPIKKGCNQELSYNFWKAFNRIREDETTDDLSPDAVGVTGQEVRTLFPSPEHPRHRYSEHIFFTQEADPRDYYHFMLMHGKAHDVHPAERELGWAFIKRFRRMPDGTLTDSLHP